ncbi:MAG: EI24 domain-containing protein [Deltaproteobacteria bacterium]|nr:EI24 domain-containing protein [Deltaproteobacteria bacterium]
MNLLGGFAAPFRALPFLWRHPTLWGYAALPFFINLGLFALGFWLAYDRFDRWVTALLPTGEGWWWVLLFYFLLILMALVLLMLGVFLFAVVGAVVAAPFLELLTRKAEALVGLAPAAGPARGILAEMWRVLRQEVKKLLLYLAVMLPLLLLNLFPGPGTAAYGVLAWLVTCYFLALQFLDYPLDRRGLTLRGKMVYLRRLGGGWLGFGSACFVLGVIPLLNLAFLPLCAVGGVLVFAQAGPPRPSPPPPPGPNQRPA